MVQVPPLSLERKRERGTPYSNRYREPEPRKQVRQDRITWLFGVWKPQSGKVGHGVVGFDEDDDDIVKFGGVGADGVSFLRVKCTTFSPPT